MSDEDPFAEPGDTDKTVIKPNPAGRNRSASTPSQPAVLPASQDVSGGAPTEDDPAAIGIPARQAAAARAETTETMSIRQAMTGMNSLNACASTLFLLISRIRNRAQHMDPDALRRSVVAEIREFENLSLKAGIEAKNVRVARYAICATLDDAVLNTPWGGLSSWTQRSMVGTFHKETVGGDRFYDLVSRLEADPANNIDLLEFLYQCLSLGFEGRLRVASGGAEKHLQIRNGLARIIRAQRGPPEQDLSPVWRGLDKPHKARSLWRLVWFVVGGLAVILSAMFFGLWTVLDGQSERSLGLMSALEGELPAKLARSAPPPKPVPRSPTGEERLVKIKDFLTPEIEEKVVEVFSKANTVTVRLARPGMFPSGSDQLKPEFQASIRRIAGSLNEESGPVIIAGHSDSIPVSSGRFASNLALSLARAESVKRIFASEFSDPTRLIAEGRGEKEPLATNTTRVGRARNRRIEIILVRDGG